MAHSNVVLAAAVRDRCSFNLIEILVEREPVFDAACGGLECVYCNLESDHKHELSCPWLAAKHFVEARRRSPGRNARKRGGFTLIELLVVITIVLLISVLTLPTIYYGMSHRQVSEAARILQANVAGARDVAARDNAPSGIRLLPDPTMNGINPATGLLDPALPLVYNRMVPITVPPAYSNGKITAWLDVLPPGVANLSYNGPGTPTNANPTWGQANVLMLYESVTDPDSGLSNEPTSWWWNIRIGDKLRIADAGKWYTVVGPMVVKNPELYVNVGQPGTRSPFVLGTDRPEFLFLVNGIDDDHDGYIDPGWDGIDNDRKNGVDDIGEWIESEVW